ncbi:MAG: succinate dehydrogenase, partial [Chloroflexi bacterium]|nr:succinate dehydrogenase [Chloroflexota bacterium]
AGFGISPALWILPFPLFFRFTCYYYRKAYYRAFFWDPPACAVGEVAKRPHYTGEREYPWLLQNLHRYAWYFAVIVLAILWWDAFDAFRYSALDDSVHYFIGVGSLIMLVNALLLSAYTFGCHSFRHLVGGCVDCFSCSSGTKTRHGIWEKVTHLNENHALWAWLSLFSVALTDLYIRMVAAGVIPDKRLL